MGVKKPKYTFNGDTNTGWYIDRNDDVWFVVNGEKIERHPKKETDKERYDRAMKGV